MPGPSQFANICFLTTRLYADKSISSSEIALGMRRPQDPSFRSHQFDFSNWHRSEEHTSELQSLRHLVCRLLLEKYGDHRDLHSFPTRRSSDLSSEIALGMRRPQDPSFRSHQFDFSNWH